MTNWLDRIGQADADTFISILAKLGNNTTAFWTAIGYEGATSLAAKLTAARAALLDQITAVRMAELDAANLPADIDTLLARLTAARAANLDELGALNIPADIDTLLARLTALRAGYLDELDFDLNARLGAPAGASLAADLLTIDNLVDDLEAAVGLIEGATTLHNKLTAARAALLDQITAVRLAELDAANLPADIDTLLARLTAARAANLDELGALNIPADIDTLLARLTALRAGYLDELDFDLNARLGTPAGASLAADLLTIDNLVDDLETRLTAARAGYLDFLPRVIAVSVTAAANAGITTVATVATQPVVIDSIVLHADAAQTANLTSAAVQGGVGQVVTFIAAADATQANLNAADKQLAWTGAIRLAVGKTIIINLVGTGAAAVDLTVTITYHAEVAGGVLS